MYAIAIKLVFERTLHDGYAPSLANDASAALVNAINRDPRCRRRILHRYGNTYVVSLRTFTMVAIGTCEFTDIAPDTLGLLNTGERDLINWFVLVTSSTISG